jgi:MFS transporter, YNFM family, putative membrane transport protein
VTVAPTAPSAHIVPARGAARLRSSAIALIAFFTLVDLFAAQAILPLLVEAYAVTPAAMGLAVNASLLGMAASGLLVALFSHRIDRRKGIIVSLVLLALPTALLATAPNLTLFAVLRVAQGLCMSAAFSLTLAYLGERCSAAAAAGAFAAYITGNVGSNLAGRLISASVAAGYGLQETFYIFAGLNLAGAAFVYFTIAPSPRPAVRVGALKPSLGGLLEHFRNPAVAAGFGIGFCILFAFIGAFTYVNFVLVRPPLSLGMMSVGLVYFVFLPSIVLTPFAGAATARFGARRSLWGSLALAGTGLLLLLVPKLTVVLAGMALVGVGTFLAQAIATGFVSRAATGDRGSASGIYLASYFCGGLAGSAVLGQVFDRLGWAACVGGIGAALLAAGLLAARLPPRG